MSSPSHTGGLHFTKNLPCGHTSSNRYYDVGRACSSMKLLPKFPNWPYMITSFHLYWLTSARPWHFSMFRNLPCIWDSSSSPSTVIWASLGTYNFGCILLRMHFRWCQKVHLPCPFLTRLVLAIWVLVLQVDTSTGMIWMNHLLYKILEPSFQAKGILEHWYFTLASSTLFTEIQPQWLTWAYNLALCIILSEWRYVLSLIWTSMLTSAKKVPMWVLHPIYCTSK